MKILCFYFNMNAYPLLVFIQSILLIITKILFSVQKQEIPYPNIIQWKQLTIYKLQLKLPNYSTDNWLFFCKTYSISKLIKNDLLMQNLLVIYNLG